MPMYVGNQIRDKGCSYCCCCSKQQAATCHLPLASNLAAGDELWPCNCSCTRTRTQTRTAIYHSKWAKNWQHKLLLQHVATAAATVAGAGALHWFLCQQILKVIANSLSLSPAAESLCLDTATLPFPLCGRPKDRAPKVLLLLLLLLECNSISSHDSSNRMSCWQRKSNVLCIFFIIMAPWDMADTY